MNKEFLKQVLSVPSASRFERVMTEFVMDFCAKNNIICEVKNGNAYLTKGEIVPSEYYPCFTAHLDTVHYNQIPYVVMQQELPITETEKDNKTIYSCPGIGIGGDDKCGIAIILDIITKVDVCKAVFFWGEEIGGLGSKQDIDLSFFENVGYVIGFDSPEYNRAAYACQGNRLFPKSFFKEQIKDVCKECGVTNFKSEPGTDVMILREKLNIVAMNFGSGYYDCHTLTEYVVYEDVLKAVDLGLKLYDKLGKNKYPFRKHKPFFSYLKWHIKYCYQEFMEEKF